MVRQKLGELLVNAGVLTDDQLQQALVTQHDSGRKLGQVLVELGSVSESQLAQTLSLQLSIPWVALQHVEFSPALLQLVPLAVAERYSLIPVFVRHVRQQGDTLYVATDDPTNELALTEVSQSTGLPVRPMIACTSDVKTAIHIQYGVPDSHPPLPFEVSYEHAATTEPMQVAPIHELPRGDSAAQVSDSGDSPDADPEIEAREIIRKPSKPTAGGFALTLLDGTTIKLPTKKIKASADSAFFPAPEPATVAPADLLETIHSITHPDGQGRVEDDLRAAENAFIALFTVLKRKGVLLESEFLDELRHLAERP